MGFTDFENHECVCSFINNLGAFKDTFIGMLDTSIGLLRAAQAAAALWPADFGDRLELLELEAELVAVQVAISAVAPPLEFVSNYFRPYADCPPMATAAQTIATVKDTILKPIRDLEDEINQKKDALDLEGSKIQKLQMWIDQLEDLKDAVNYCGTV
jgi:hypothetical protein